MKGAFQGLRLLFSSIWASLALATLVYKSLTMSPSHLPGIFWNVLPSSTPKPVPTFARIKSTPTSLSCGGIPGVIISQAPLLALHSSSCSLQWPVLCLGLNLQPPLECRLLKLDFVLLSIIHPAPSTVPGMFKALIWMNECLREWISPVTWPGFLHVDTTQLGATPLA